MIWDKISLLRILPATRRAAVTMGNRWHDARRAEPELMGDLIRLGGVMQLQPIENGEPLPPDPLRLAYEAGRRDLALQLLGLMALTGTELSTLMETNDV